MQVFKFGGASLAHAGNVAQVGRIVSSWQQGQGRGGTLVVVVSAMEKNTNRLERLLEATRGGDSARARREMEDFRQFHLHILSALFPEHAIPQGTMEALQGLFRELEVALEAFVQTDYAYHYDRVIPYGELLSSRIVTDYLQSLGLPVRLVDARAMLRSNALHRFATVDMQLSGPLVRAAMPAIPGMIYVTQGFIASSGNAETTTLGREGSDYTAALLGAFLQAQSVTIWKDVEGLFCADPRLFPKAAFLPCVDYRDAIELSYHGAKVIHPKAIKPLQNAGIPLHVRPFAHPDREGSVVCSFDTEGNQPHALKNPAAPLLHLAIKEKQRLLSFTPHDLSLALEEDGLGVVFSTLQSHGLRIGLVNTSAVSVSVCVEEDAPRIARAIEALQPSFRITYNLDLILLTLRNYTPESCQLVERHPGILIRQTTRSTSQYLLTRQDWEGVIYPQLAQYMARTCCQLSGERCVP